MIMTKMKITAAIVLGVGLTAIGAGFYAASGGDGSAGTTQEESPEQPPSTAGRIIIAGSKHTMTDVVPQQIPLDSGQVITDLDLRRANANLARLNIFEVNNGIQPTGAVLDPDGDNPVKDLLVTVQEVHGGLFGTGVNSAAGLNVNGGIASNEPEAKVKDQTAPAKMEDARQPVWVRSNGVALCADEIRLHIFRALCEAEPTADELRRLTDSLKSMHHLGVVLDELVERELLVLDAFENLKKRPQCLDRLKAYAEKDCERFLSSDMGKAMLKFQQAQGIEPEVLHRWRERTFMAAEYKRHLLFGCESIGHQEIAQYYQEHDDQFRFRPFDEKVRAEIRETLVKQMMEREYRRWVAERRHQTAIAQQPTDLTDVPAGALVLDCKDVQVFATAQVDGKLTLQMEGHGLAAVTAAQFRGEAEVIKYDEEKGLIVLQARADERATLHLPKSNGATGEIQGMKIYYRIRTGAFKIEGS